MKAATAIHRIAFVTAFVVYVVGTASLLRQHPALLASLLEHPLRPANLFLLGVLGAIAVALCPVCGRLAKLVAGDRELE